MKNSSLANLPTLPSHGSGLNPYNTGECPIAVVTHRLALLPHSLLSVKIQPHLQGQSVLGEITQQHFLSFF